MNFLFNRKKNTVFPLIWILIYSAIIPMQLSNYVLCISEDGHVKFEFSVNGCCTHAPSHDLEHPEMPFTDTTDADEDHCGECLDLPIFASLNSEPTIVSLQNYLSSHEVVLSTSLISDEPTVSSILPTTAFSIIPPLINPTLISLRTVTLLI